MHRGQRIAGQGVHAWRWHRRECNACCCRRTEKPDAAQSALLACRRSPHSPAAFSPPCGFTALPLPPGSMQRILFTCKPNQFQFPHRPAPRHPRLPPKQRPHRPMQRRRRQPRRPCLALWESGRHAVVATMPTAPPRRRPLSKRLRTQNRQRPRTAAITQRLRPWRLPAPCLRQVRSGSPAWRRRRPNWPLRHGRAAHPALHRQPSKCGR